MEGEGWSRTSGPLSFSRPSWYFTFRCFEDGATCRSTPSSACLPPGPHRLGGSSVFGHPLNFAGPVAPPSLLSSPPPPTRLVALWRPRGASSPPSHSARRGRTAATWWRLKTSSTSDLRKRYFPPSLMNGRALRRIILRIVTGSTPSHFASSVAPLKKGLSVVSVVVVLSVVVLVVMVYFSAHCRPDSPPPWRNSTDSSVRAVTPPHHPRLKWGHFQTCRKPAHWRGLHG